MSSPFTTIGEGKISGGHQTVPFERKTTVDTIEKQAEGTALLVVLVHLSEIGPHKLKWPIVIEVYKVNNIYIAEDHEFNLWGDGTTIDEAIDSIQAFFSHEYQRYIDIPDDRMDLLARREKSKYIQWVKA
ncbi:MAG: hypothetical protein GH143_02210 [Calditrichaeota bacterium]|nr:hypothetical protein [Calditrichota bacterium]